MAANPKPPADTSSSEERYHEYHAEAHVLSGNLKHPVDQPIQHQARVILERTRVDDHITRSVEATTLEGLISFRAGHSRASGSRIEKKDAWGKDHSGWVTLSTSVIEGLNVFEVITADRVVAQVSTEHADKKGQYPDHVPKVTFLGTRFENLRIGGYPVEVKLDLEICGDKPKHDRPYLTDSGFLGRVERQVGLIARAKGLPKDLEQEFDTEIEEINDLRKRGNVRAKGKGNGYPELQCSLVKSIGRIPIPGVKTFGNIIFIPDFGTVSLAEVKVGVKAEKSGNGSSNASNYFTLNMLNMRLGCIGGGNVVAGSTTSNGHTHP